MIRFLLFIFIYFACFYSCSEKDSISMGIEGDSIIFDPVFATNVYMDHIYSQVFETLFLLDEDYMTIHNHLIDEWFAGPEGQMYQFKLKPGIRFHDQKPLHSEHVRFSIQRYRQRGDRWPLNGLIDHFEIIDSLSFVIHLTRPYAPFLYCLCSPHLLLIQSQLTKNQALSNITEVVGTGPFMLDQISKGRNIILKSNMNYRDRPARLDKISFYAYDDPQQQVEALREGDVDIIYMVSSHMLDRLKWTGRVEYLVGKPLNIYFLGFNNEHPFFSDLNIRKAILYALDRPKIVVHSGRGNADVAEGPLPAVYKRIQAQKQSEYNPDKARYLFSKSNLRPKQSILLNIPAAGNIRHITAEFIKDQLSQFGFKIKIKLNDNWPDHKTAISAKMTELFIYALNDEIVGDPGPFLKSLFHSKSEQNYLKYRNIFVDSLLNRAERTFDIQERNNLYTKITNLIIDDSPAVFIKHIIPHFAYRSEKITAMQVTPYQLLDFYQLRLHE